MIKEITKKKEILRKVFQRKGPRQRKKGLKKIESETTFWQINRNYTKEGIYREERDFKEK